MAFVPGFEYDIFISYSHIDNIPFHYQDRGWVDSFHYNLKVLIEQRLAQQGIGIWFDKPQIEGNTFFDETIKKAINKSAIIVCINSKAYLHSHYCNVELNFFWEKINSDGDIPSIGDRSRIVNVLLYDIPFTEWPKPLNGNTGYPFYSKENNLKWGDPIDTDSKGFLVKLRSLRDSICDLLEDLKKEKELQFGIEQQKILEISAEKEEQKRIKQEEEKKIQSRKAEEELMRIKEAEKKALEAQKAQEQKRIKQEEEKKMQSRKAEEELMRIKEAEMKALEAQKAQEQKRVKEAEEKALKAQKAERELKWIKDAEELALQAKIVEQELKRVKEAEEKALQAQKTEQELRQIKVAEERQHAYSATEKLLELRKKKKKRKKILWTILGIVFLGICFWSYAYYTKTEGQRYYSLAARFKTTSVLWLENMKAASGYGNDSANKKLGDYYQSLSETDTMKKSKEDSAIFFYKLLANHNDAYGQWQIGYSYSIGRGGLKQSDSAAVVWLRKSAGQGNAWAENRLGVMYLSGRGVLNANDTTAAFWFSKSADHGNVVGEYHLATMYEKGAGGLGPKDTVLAAYWYQKAADQGDSDAADKLGDFYLSGSRGLPQSLSKAKKMYQKACNGQIESACKILLQFDKN